MPIAREGSAARRSRIEWSLLGFLLLSLAGLLAYTHVTMNARELAVERDRLRVQADVVADDLERNLHAISLTLQGVIRDYRFDGSTSPGDISRALQALVDAAPGVRGMGIYGRDGVMLASNRTDLVGKDFSTRLYFTSARDNPDTRTLFLSPPFKAVTNDLVATVGRVVPAANGAFAGVVVATLDPAYLTSVLRPVMYAPDVWAAIVHGDGVQLTNFPMIAGTDGSDLNVAGSFFRRHRDAGFDASILTGPMHARGEDRVMALRTVNPAQLHMDKPMVIQISRSMAAVTGPMRRQMLVYSLLFGLFALASCVALYWSQRRREHIRMVTTERDQTRLQAAEKVQLALRGANLGMWEIQLPGNRWTVDETVAAMAGLSLVELTDTPEKWRSLMHPQDREESARAFAACADGSTPFYDFTYRLRHREGRWVWILARGQTVERDAHGRAVRIMGTAMDISKAKQTESEVVQSRNELQAVFDHMAEAILVFDDQYRLVRVNRAGRTVQGLFDAEVPREVSLSCLEAVSPDGQVLSTDQWPSARAMRGDFVRDYEVLLRRKDTGASLYVESTTAPIPGTPGQPGLVLHTYRDVTERRIGLALRQSEARFRALIEEAPLAIAIMRAGVIAYANPRYHALHGYSGTDDLTDTGWSALLADDADAVVDTHVSMIASDSPVEQSFEATGRGKSGALVQVLNTTTRVALTDGAATLVFAQDISAQKSAEAALVQARDVAEQANRSKAEFLANMSHEIRSPMSVILGLAYLLEKVALTADAHDMVLKIRGAGRRLMGIINDILDVSKIEAGRMDLERAPFRLGDVVDNVASTMGLAAGDKNIELVVEQDAACAGSYMGDALRLEQVLVNLASNAIKFTSVGQVVLRVDLQERNGEFARMRFSVRDTGIGIPPELQSEVFTAFSQADSSTTRRFGGTGLGLTICRQLVSLMGGEIGLNSVLDEGSEFWFTTTLQAIPEGDLSSPGMSRINTLVADDSPIARDAVVATARGLGWVAEAVDSGEAAVACVLERRGSRMPDVVVLDWKMPGMDGLRVARTIRETVAVSECPIVIMATAYALSSLATEPEAELVDAILSKPLTISALYNAVLEACRRRANVDLLRTQPDAARELEGVRLLVVDDSEINCEVARRILQEHGAEVHLAFDGGAALEWLLAHPADVDLVLIDVQMPVMDGLEVTRRLRVLPQFMKLPIVALTAGAFKSQQEAAIEAGMTDFVGKPFDVPSTIGLIQRLTRNRVRRARCVAAQPVAQRVAVPVAPERVVMDVNQGLSTWGKLDTYRDYLRRFVESYCDSAASVATSLAAGDRMAALALAHKLAGVAANMALPEVYRLASDLERWLTEERDATGVLAQLDAALREACDSIERFAPAPGSSAPAIPAALPALDGRTAARVRDLLDQLMEELDTDSPVPADPIVAQLAQLLPCQLLDDVRAFLRGFDFRGAEARVRELARELGISIER